MSGPTGDLYSHTGKTGLGPREKMVLTMAMEAYLQRAEKKKAKRFKFF
jgi:hypothetical protein